MGIVPNINHGKKAESKLSKRIGGRETLASGALIFDKADVKIDGFRIECKSTIKDSMSVKFGWLNKVSAEALDHTEKPALSIQFVTENGQAKKCGSWVAIRELDFEEYLWLRKRYEED